jgi:hypothetical protein
LLGAILLDGHALGCRNAIDIARVVVPADALAVINWIISHGAPSGPDGEGEAAVDAGLLLYLLENGPDYSTARKSIAR